MPRARAAQAALQTAFPGAPATILIRAPGRVNLIGEHIDYNGGHVLPLAVSQALWLAARPREDRQVRAFSPEMGAADGFELDDPDGPPGGSWLRYPYGVARALEQDDLTLPGLDVGLASSIPLGAGLSSSAALELAFALTWCTTTGVKIPRPRLAELCRQAEVETVGVACGIMDQFICALARAGHALLLDTRTLACRHVPLPSDRARIVVVDSRLPRTLAGSAYNQRRAECDQALRLIQQQKPGVMTLCDLWPSDLPNLLPLLPPPIDRRCRHAVEENARVLGAVAALDADDLERIGLLMNASHASLRDLYEVSVPELDLLTDLARGVPGVFGARLTGAGFGGCTVNLMSPETVPAFRTQVRRAYRQATGLDPAIYVCRAVSGASVRRIA